MRLNPYLMFDGNCEEALEFYRECLGGEFESINRFSDGPDEIKGMKVPDHLKDKIMHMTLRFGDNVIMASDSMHEVSIGGNVTLCINIDDESEIDNVFDRLSAGGQITMPLENTFWGSRFGMFTDKFGLKWMFSCHLKP